MQESTLKRDWDISTIFSFLGEGNGIIEKKRNIHSEFQFIHQAPLDGYEPHFEYYSCEKDSVQTIARTFPSNHGYYIFRVSRKGEDGRDVFYYGIIEKLNVGKSMKKGDMYFDITYCLNSNPDDRNIEYFY